MTAPLVYNPGDPVWARTDGDKAFSIAPGEYPAVIQGVCTGKCECNPCTGRKFYCHHTATDPGYRIDVLTQPCPYTCGWCSSPDSLRPRRDDYQQHEPRARLADLDLLRETVRAGYRVVSPDPAEISLRDVYNSICDGGLGGPCSQPDCEICWPISRKR